MNNYKKVAIYCRKSSEAEDRQIHSLESQEDEMKILARKLEISTVVKTIKESKSAKSPSNREGFDELVRMIESGEVDTLLVWNPDRLSRNSVDSGKLLYLMDVGKLKEISTPMQTFTNTPTEKFMLNMIWGQAKYENDNKGVNVKRGMRKKLEMGWYPFVAPIGYLNTPDREKGERVIVKDNERFVVVRKLWDLLSSGNYTVPEIQDIAVNKYKLRKVKRKNSGGNLVTRSGLYEMFKNPFYYGWFNVNGKWYEGSHPYMISKDVFDTVQEVLGRTNFRRPIKHKLAYTGLFKCFECGCSVTGTHKEKYYPKTENTAIYEYYHCTRKNKDVSCSQKSIKPLEIEEQISEVLESIEIHPLFRDWAIKFLREYSREENNLGEDVKRNLKRELARLKGKKSSLLDMSLEGQIDASEHDNKREEILDKERNIKSRLNAYLKEENKWLRLAEDSFNFACEARKKFEKGDIYTKREIINKLGSNYFLNDGKLVFDLKKPFFIFKKATMREKYKNQSLELVENPDILVKVGVSEPQSLLWLPIVSFIRTVLLEVFV